MNWVLLVTMISWDSISSQQIPMTEVNCRHYEKVYNSRVLDYTKSFNGSYQIIRYNAQCLRAQ